MKRNNPPEPLNSRVDYFCLNDSTATIKLAKAIVIINFQKLSSSITPFLFGSVPTTLEKSYSFALLVTHIPTSYKNIYSYFNFDFREIFI
jgi:hypothetical protein